MSPRPASLGAGLAMVVLLLAGCVATPGDGVFGPANSLGGAEAGSPALSIKASPARGPGPLDVEFSLSARQGDGPVSWSLDFGDRSAPAAGTELPANPRHTYQDPGAYVATFKVRGEGEATTTLSIVVLEGLVPGTAQPSPTQGPEPPSYSPPQSSSSSSGPTSTTAPTSASSSTTPSPEPPSNSSTSSSSSPTETTSPSSTTSESETQSSSQTTTTSSSTSQEPTASESPTPSQTQSSSESTTTTEEPSPSGSESQTSSDPPL